MAGKKFRLMQFFYGCFFINIISVLVLAILDTQNNLPVHSMLIFPLLVSAVIFLGSLLVSRLTYSCLAKILKSNCTLILFLCFYFFALSAISIFSRAIPDNDHYEVYRGALYAAGLAEESNWEYFARCDNNIIPMLLLSIIIRVNQFLGFPEPYYLAVFLNVFQVAITMYCVFRLLSGYVKQRQFFFLPWIGVGLIGIFMPVIGHTQSVYTDAMSFAFGITAYYTWTKVNQYEKKVYKSLFILLSGILWGMGAAIKMTVLISFIAVFCFLTASGKLRTRLKDFILTGIVVAIILLITQGIARSQPCQEMRDVYGLPSTYWIGIGITGNGGYTDNQEYSIRLREIYGMDEKSDFSREYIKDRLLNFADIRHVAAKARYNFASGNMGSSDFMRQTENRNFFYECISTEGRFFWRFSTINASLFYSMQLFILIGIARQWRRLRTGERINELHAVAIFTIIGIGIYLMIFEANNRQLYNHYSWFVIGAVLGLSELLEKFEAMRNTQDKKWLKSGGKRRNGKAV